MRAPIRTPAHTWLCTRPRHVPYSRFADRVPDLSRVLQSLMPEIGRKAASNSAKRTEGVGMREGGVEKRIKLCKTYKRGRKTHESVAKREGGANSPRGPSPLQETTSGQRLADQRSAAKSTADHQRSARPAANRPPTQPGHRPPASKPTSRQQARQEPTSSRSTARTPAWSGAGGPA